MRSCRSPRPPTTRRRSERPRHVSFGTRSWWSRSGGCSTPTTASMAPARCGDSCIEKASTSPGARSSASCDKTAWPAGSEDDAGGPRSPAMWEAGPRISSIASSERRRPMSCGSPTSPTWRPGPASPTPRSSPTCSPGASSAGPSPTRCAPTSPSTRWRWPSGLEAISHSISWCTTATGACSICRSATPNASPLKARSPPSAAEATAC